MGYRYASGTDVSVARSRAEIEDLVTRYGATKFGSMIEDGRAAILFEANGKRVRFILPLPSRDDFRKGFRKVNANPGTPFERTPEQQSIAWEQACRQRWRALALVVKAKLEAVSAGITEFDVEFLAHIVLPNGQTVGEVMVPQLAAAYSSGKMPPMLQLGPSKP